MSEAAFPFSVTTESEAITAACRMLAARCLAPGPHRTHPSARWSEHPVDVAAPVPERTAVGWLPLAERLRAARDGASLEVILE